MPASTETKTLLERYPIFCYHCGKPVRDGDYRVIGINMYGWPDKLPSSIVTHKNCLTAEDVIRYKIRCEYCGDWFSSVEADSRFCGFQCEHNYWSEKQAAIARDSYNPPAVGMTDAVRELVDALKSKKVDEQSLSDEPQAEADDAPVVSSKERGNAPVRRIPQAYTDPLSPFVPRNEQGVVFLFGSAISDIGYHMLDIRSQYPDATLISPSGLQIEMEFEYVSSNFIAHKHDPMMCHLVVCWIADKELSVPTIELCRYYDTSKGLWNFVEIET